MGMILKDTSSSLFNTYHISVNDKECNWFEIDDCGGSLSIKIHNGLTGDKQKIHYYLEFPADGEFAQNLFKVFKRIKKNNKA